MTKQLTQAVTKPLLLALILAICNVASAQQHRVPVPAASHVLERDVLAHEEFLASDALQGRGSGTRDEWIAATYVASQFRQFGLLPGASTADALAKDAPNPYIQAVQLEPTPSNVTLHLGTLNLQHGKEMGVLRLGASAGSAPLNKLQPGANPQRGAAAFISLTQGANDPPVRNQIIAPAQQGASMVLVGYSDQLKQRYDATVAAEVRPMIAEGSTIVLLGPEATKAVAALAEGTPVSITTEAGKNDKFTYNTIGMLKGSDPKQRAEVILITSHIDHLGINPKLPGDKIFNGADDDASGVVAVLELARAMARTKPKRTVYFVTFGSEETGGQGNQYFLAHPPVPLADIVANLEFEMIGRPDPKVARNTLWLTGYERSNLGPELAAHGAKIVADPHPEEKFFTRSDNYALAKKGVVAQTVSSYGLHKEYHTPADDLAHLDVEHLTRSIDSMIKPVIWLADSTFKPQWKAGGKP